MQQNIAHNLQDKQRTKDVLIEEDVNFTSLLLSPNIKKGLSESGFRKPSPIQFKAIPLGRCGFDLIVKSKSGTGKTLVFTVAALETVNTTKDHLQVLILVPTREIAVQIQDVVKNIGRHINALSVQSFIGGLPLEEDIKKANKCHIAVGAPGRVKHLITLGALMTKGVKLFVLDEADKLMDTTFKNDINDIYDSLPQRKQIITTSATYPQELDTFLTNYMLSPTHVTSENETPLLLGLKQFAAVLKGNTINAVQQMKAKNELLLNVFSKVSFTQCLVFTNYQSRTESVCNFLNQKGWTSSFISAAIDQNERLEAINNLKNFKSRILLSTDLTSRGIDAPNVDLVINYDLPNDAATYLHRMGRAGRYGSPGICINFVLEGTEIKTLQYILGTIGATNLSISKLPPLTENKDLWRLDLNDLEQIWGVVPKETTNDVQESIKKEVLTLKQRVKENKSKNKNSKNSKKKIKLEELSNSECVEDLLKKKKNEDIYKIDSACDAEDLFRSIVSEQNDFSEDDNKKRKRSELQFNIGELSNPEFVQDILKSKKETEDNIESSNVDAEDLLSSLVLNEDDTKKRKLDASPKQEDIQLDTKKVQGDVQDSIGDYLAILKQEEAEAEVKNVEILKCDDSLNSSVSSIKTEQLDFIKQEPDVIESIFKIGYECAIKNEDRSFLHCLPNEELEKFQESCRQERDIISSDSENEDEEEDVEDYEMEDPNREDICEEEADENNDTALQWVPVVQNKTNEPGSSDHFVQCYEDCSTTLWQTGLTFETVSEFDDWFLQWQEQVQSVRNYVQQNIYVEEMSKYQQNRLTNK